MNELRKDPLTATWVIFAPSRNRDSRPVDVPGPSGRDGCPYCPGTASAEDDGTIALVGGESFPGAPFSLALRPAQPPLVRPQMPPEQWGEGMFDLAAGHGHHEVLVESPLHGDDFDTYPPGHGARVLQVLRDRVATLEELEETAAVCVTRDRGWARDGSWGHPCSQLVALPVIPKRLAEEVEGARAYENFRERCATCDMIEQDRSEGTRTLGETDRFFVCCPYASRFPYEVAIRPKRHEARFSRSTDDELTELAGILAGVLRRLKEHLGDAPLACVLHTAPTNGPERLSQGTLDRSYHWHLAIVPKVARLAGFEWGTGFFLNPVLPEVAAEQLASSLES